MKKLLLLFFLLTVLPIFGQKERGPVLFRFGDQFLPAEIHYSNGDREDGKARIKASNLFRKADIILFISRGTTRKLKLDHRTVSSITFSVGSTKKTYLYKLIAGTNTPTLLQRIATGRAEVFKECYRLPNNSLNQIDTTLDIQCDIYTGKQGEYIVSNFHSNGFTQKQIRATAIEYFNDCPALVEKIKNKEYKQFASPGRFQGVNFERSTILDMVLFYNRNCSDGNAIVPLEGHE